MAITTAETQDQSRSEVPVQTVTNTGFGNLISKACFANQYIDLPQYTTLNERYDVMPDTSIGKQNARNFELKYFGIGIGGSSANGLTSLGTTRLKVNQHQPTDMNLFAAIPFIARPLTNPLSNVERANFRMRVVETLLDGQLWEVYYLCLISFLEYDPKVSKVVRDEAGNEDAKTYVPTKDSLFNPQPEDITSVGVTPVSNTYQNSSGILDCSLSANLLTEIANACKAKYGDASYASINETMIAAGYDVQFDGAISGGGTIRYTEVKSAVACHYVCERDGRNALNNTKLQLAFDHGASEPMLVHTNATGN